MSEAQKNGPTPEECLRFTRAEWFQKQAFELAARVKWETVGSTPYHADARLVCSHLLTCLHALRAVEDRLIAYPRAITYLEGLRDLWKASCDVGEMKMDLTPASFFELNQILSNLKTATLPLTKDLAEKIFNAGYNNADDSYPGPDFDAVWWELKKNKEVA